MSRLSLFLLCGFWALHAWATPVPDNPEDRLQKAIVNPEFVLHHWIELPTSPQARKKAIHRMSLREAILLALRYNPNIQNAELDRIVQRYDLRLAHNEFELQYALGASGVLQKSTFNGIGTDTTRTLMASPEFDLRTKLGTQATLGIDNNVTGENNNNFNPVLNFSSHSLC